MFFYLLHNRGKQVHKSLLIELLWPNFEISKASSQLYTAIYLIRKTLEPFGDRFQIKKLNDGYTLQLRDAVLDAEEFESLLESEAALNEETAPEIERKLRDVQGEYFESYDYLWAEPLRQRYSMHWIRLMMKLVKWHIERQNPENALQLCDLLCSRYPLEEEAQLAYLKISDQLGLHFLVQRQYRLYASLLQREYDESPGAELAEWYRRWEKRNDRP